jgi:hypothetical protein
MYPDAAFQAKVDALIREVEAYRGGTRCAIRSVPVDMIAASVAGEVLAMAPPAALQLAVATVLTRYEGRPVRLDGPALVTVSPDLIGGSMTLERPKRDGE